MCFSFWPFLISQPPPLAMEGGHTTSKLWRYPEPIRDHALASMYSLFQPKMACRAQALIRKSCFTMKCNYRTTGGFCQEEFILVFFKTKLNQKNVWFLLLVKGGGFALKGSTVLWNELEKSDFSIWWGSAVSWVSSHPHHSSKNSELPFFFLKDFTLALITKVTSFWL